MEASNETTAPEVLTLTSKPEDENVETIVLFNIDGVDYSVPKKPRTNVGLKYIRDLRKVGENLAVANLLVELLGEEGFDALSEYDDLTTEDMTRVVTIAQKLIFGELEVASGN